MQRHVHAGLFFMVALLTLLIGSGCAPTTAPTAADVLEDAALRYQRAIAAAETLGVEAIRPLTPITAEASVVQWQGAPGESSVRVVNWTSAPDLAPGDSLVTDGEVWVTLAPKVQDFCQTSDLPEAALTMRLRQKIGLPPDAPYDTFVTYWADPDDLFRPCPDPQITDRDCPLTFPRSARFLTVSDAHREWIATTAAFSYQPDGYPWTNLGYTYDWGPTDDVFGFSEYVIRPGAAVAVDAVDATAAYCATAAPE